MTPRDTANQIFNSMMAVTDPMGSYPMCFETAKQCAIICVNNMLNVCAPEELEYFTNVHIVLQTYKIREHEEY